MKNITNNNQSSRQQYREQLWYELQTKQYAISKARIENLFDSDPLRVDNFSINAAGLLLDFSKNLVDENTLQLLIRLAKNSQLKDNIEALFKGREINNTEHRSALHMSLRNKGHDLPKKLKQEVQSTYQHMEEFVKQLHQQQWLGYKNEPVTDIVNIGIGGSDLGPVMASLALTPYAQSMVNVHFVSNIDSTHIAEKLKTLDPGTTLFIVASKSFKTIETLKNAEAARNWCFDHGMKQLDLAKHFVAVSTNISEATKFGIDEKNIFPMWDWVGGRYSLWSAIGLPIAIKVGMDNFQRMLKGGGEMDEHFRNTEMRFNMPIILGLLSVWYINFFGCEAHVVIPYDHYLHKFPAFLQQLEMESNGKSVRRDGNPVEYHTMGAIFGEAGSNTQHSFHQLLHQGTHLFPVDFIVSIQTHNPIADQHKHLYANCLSQSRALMCGRSIEQVIDELSKQGFSNSEIEELAPHKVIHGNKPSNTIVMEKLTPETLGALIALYEHKVFVESVIWDIDAFDQWGVELGKSLSEEVYVSLASDNAGQHFDASTEKLIARFKNKNI